MRIRISEASPALSPVRRRVAARRGRDEVVVGRAHRVAALRDLVFALMADRRERYSVEVALELGLDPARAYTRVRSALTALADEGALSSRFAPAEQQNRSGLGRRYYRLSLKG